MTLAAPLLDIPQAPVPAAGAAEWFRGADGARLRAALFQPPGEARGSVVVSPGRTEPIEKYYEVVGELQARGFVVLVHDWRGQGLSHRLLPDRLKGHALGFADFVADYHALLAHFESRLPGPWIALGHSMGGCLTTLALAHGEADRFAGAFLSAPMLGLQTPGRPKAAARALAWVMARLKGDDYILGQPGDPHGGPFEGNVLTHDPVRYARNIAQVKACPDLALGAGTWAWLDFAFTASAWLKTAPGVAAISIPVVVLGAAEEALVDNADQRAVVARMPQGSWTEVPGARHELFQETDDIRARVWAAFDTLAAEVVP
ncbi:MAG: alpha/beta fold hydrolase [Caulobacter sp.]|nr:alpha/beta fold hydrolase [Caulobacter sp.]